MPIDEMNTILKDKECEVEWKVNSDIFFKKKETYVCSPPFSFEGESWDLGMWPNGQNSMGFFDLCLFRLRSGPPMKVEFCFSLKTVNGRKDLERHETGDFHWRHYIDRFISNCELVRRRNEFENSGFLTFVCTLRRIDSTESESKYCLYDRENREFVLFLLPPFLIKANFLFRCQFYFNFEFTNFIHMKYETLFQTINDKIKIST